jgi:CHASE1-domain containing sensor protein
VKVGDLVRVGKKGEEKRFPSIILEICLPENHRNGMYLIKILEQGQPKWYPVGYIEVINENRRSGENKI